MHEFKIKGYYLYPLSKDAYAHPFEHHMAGKLSRSFSQRKLLLPYGRLLGFRRDAAPLLSAVKKHSSIPLISKPADAEKLLAPKELSLLKQDIFCSDIYEAVHFAKTKETPLNEYRQSPIIL